MAAEQTPLTWLLRKRTPGKAWSEWIVCGKADFDAIKAKPLNWGMEYEAVAVVALPAGVMVDAQPHPKCVNPDCNCVMRCEAEALPRGVEGSPK